MTPLPDPLTRARPAPPRAALLVACAAALCLLLSGCLGGIATNSGRPGGSGSFGGAKEWSPEVLHTLGDPESSGMKSWTKQFDAPPKAFDLDGDGRDELIAMGSDTFVHVFDVDSGRVLARLKTTYPPAWHIERVLNPVEAAVLEPGQPASIVATDHAAYVAVWRYEAAGSSETEMKFTKVWEQRMDTCRKSPAMDAKPVLADLDGDGRLEIIVQTEEVGFYALRADGTPMWHQCWAGGNGPATVGDLDADGKPEVVFASDSGFLSVIDGRSGKPDWTYDVKTLGIDPGSISVAATIAELDGQAPQEVLVTARHAPSEDETTWPDAHMAIVAVHMDLATYQAQLLWAKQPEWANPLSYTQLVVHDIDGDGRADIFGMDWNTIGHRPGDWEVLGPAHVFRLDANGDDVWVRTMDAWWSNKDIALAKIDGDYSILVNGPSGEYDGLWRLSAHDGKAQAFLPLKDWKMTRGPLLYDLWHNGNTQLVFPIEPNVGAEGRGAIRVYDLKTGYDAPWKGAP